MRVTTSLPRCLHRLSRRPCLPPAARGLASEGHGVYTPDEMSDFDDILLERPTEGVVKLTLNQARKRNALSSHMMRVLQTHLDSISRDKGVRAVVLAADGPAFSAGHDLKEMKALREQGLEGYQNIFTQCSILMQSVVNLPQPIIAQVQGMATAAGCQLVSSCDMVVACAESARFATPGVNIGLFCSTPMVALSRKVGRNHAMEMLLTGEPISAQRAYEIGLVNRIVSGEGEIEKETLSLATLIASKPTTAVKIGKEAFYQQLERPLADAYELTSEVMAQNMMEDDAEEGVSAFLEKRQPTWNN